MRHAPVPSRFGDPGGIGIHSNPFRLNSHPHTCFDETSGWVYIKQYDMHRRSENGGQSAQVRKYS